MTDTFCYWAAVRAVIVHHLVTQSVAFATQRDSFQWQSMICLISLAKQDQANGDKQTVRLVHYQEDKNCR